MSKQKSIGWPQWLKERIFGITDQLIAGLLVTAVISVIGSYLSSQAIAWEMVLIPEILLLLAGVFGVVAIIILIWRTYERRSRQLEAFWQERIFMLRVLCKAGLHRQKGQQALKNQKWSLAWGSFEQAIREILNYFETDGSLLKAIEASKADGMFGEKDWRKLRNHCHDTLQGLRPQILQVCGVELPFGAEIIDDLQKALLGMEETYQYAMELLRRGAWWKALITLTSMASYGAKRQIVRLMIVVAPVVVVLLVIIVTSLFFQGTIRLPVEKYVPTATISLDDLRFAITCADGSMHITRTHERTIKLWEKSVIIIEPSIAPQDFVSSTGELNKLPGEEKKFAYLPGGFGEDILIFVFVDEKTGHEESKALPITIGTEQRGLCYP